MAMNGRRRSFRSPLPRRPRRKLIWARYAQGVVVNPGGTFQGLPLNNFETLYGANLIGATVFRIRGVISATLVGPTNPVGAQAYAAVRCGMRVTDHSDINQTDYQVGAMYLNQAHADWFMFEPFMLDNAGTIAANTDEVDTTAASEIRHVDVKARRRIDELEQSLEFLVGAPAPGSTAPPENTSGARIRWDLSILVALP